MLSSKAVCATTLLVLLLVYFALWTPPTHNAQSMIFLSEDAYIAPSDYGTMELLIHRDTPDAPDKFHFAINGKSLTFKNVLDELLSLTSKNGNGEIVRLLSRIIKTSNHKSIYWECNPVKLENYESLTFQFVILDAPSLHRRGPDALTFAEHFTKCGAAVVTSFKSLGNDSILIAPCPRLKSSENSHMAHLKAFVEGTAEEEISQLLWIVARRLQDKLLQSPSTPLWLSTSGEGVSWLHVRIDTRPKYYNLRDYMDPNYRPVS